MREYEAKIRKAIAAKIRNRRHELGMSQMKLAELVDCHLNALGRIERGQADPSLSLFIRIACALECKIKDLIPDDIIPFP